jgi:mannose-6-phosphate isomerase class I
MVGVAEKPHILVCIAGSGQLEYDDANYAVGKGDVLLLSAVVGTFDFRPQGAVNLLEIALPE